MAQTGDRTWMENLEDVAFNDYPAALTEDMKALRYLTCPNQVQADANNHHPGIDNSGPFFCMNPFSSRCCQHNHGFAWPYYSQYLVLATPDNGVGLTLYNDCTARVKVGSEGQEVTFREQTHYPFEDRIRVTVETAGKVSFPLYLRIPSWSRGAIVRVNGRNVGIGSRAGSYLRIERKWRSGDKLDIRFKPHLRGVPPPPGAPQALQKAGDGVGGVDVEGPLQPPDVDAQLQGGGGADAHEGVVVLHLLLGALPVGGGEVAVVDEEAVRLVYWTASMWINLRHRIKCSHSILTSRYCCCQQQKWLLLANRQTPCQRWIAVVVDRHCRKEQYC